MSRTQKGSKKAGYDYWSKRPYSGCGIGAIVKKLCHKAERMQYKEDLHKLLKNEDNLQEPVAIVVYPLTDERVRAHALKQWGKREGLYLVDAYTHYNLEQDWFCTQDDAIWKLDNYSVGHYDDYLRELHSTKLR